MELLDQQVDSLAALEERIQDAIGLVARLRRENETLAAERDAAQKQAAGFGEELETLRAERRQVRGRIEKLLSQIDSLNG